MSTGLKGGQAQDAEQLPDAGRYGLTLGTAPPVTRPWRGQAEQVIGCRLVEVQDPGQRLEDLDGGVAVAALLEPRVVVGADPGEHRDLFTPQPRDSAHSLTRRPPVSGWTSSRRARR